MNGRDGYPGFAAQVAMGVVPGFETFRKFGMNPDVNGSGTAEDVWPIGTPKVLPTEAAIAVVSSDSSEDDPDDGVDAGTGAHAIVIEGVDANYLRQSETITLNGTANVNGTSTWMRIDRAYVTIVGTNAANVGNITVTVGGNAQAYIEAEEGQSHQMGFVVPADEYIMLNEYVIGLGRMAGTSDAQMELQIRLYNESSNNNYEGWRSQADNYLFNGQSLVNDSINIVIPPKADVRVQITSTATTQCFSEVVGFRIKTGTYQGL